MDHFLVKLLDPVMVDKQITTPVSNEKPTSDENGVEAVNYDSVKTETKTVESSFRKGIVLKLPASFYSDENVRNKIKIGDTVLFPESCGKNFDLLKDSRLVRYYDIIAIEL